MPSKNIAPTPAATAAPGLSPRPSELYIDCTAANAKVTPSPMQIIAETYLTAVMIPPLNDEAASTANAIQLAPYGSRRSPASAWVQTGVPRKFFLSLPPYHCKSQKKSQNKNRITPRFSFHFNVTGCLHQTSRDALAPTRSRWHVVYAIFCCLCNRARSKPSRSPPLIFLTISSILWIYGTFTRDSRPQGI